MGLLASVSTARPNPVQNPRARLLNRRGRAMLSTWRLSHPSAPPLSWANSTAGIRVGLFFRRRFLALLGRCYAIGMDKANIQRRLANAEKHIVEGARHIAQQQKLIWGMARLGRDTSVSEQLLQTFEETQRLRLADRDKLLRQLSAPRP